jgi:hypothetical protein
LVFDPSAFVEVTAAASGSDGTHGPPPESFEPESEDDDDGAELALSDNTTPGGGFDDDLRLDDELCAKPAAAIPNNRPSHKQVRSGVFVQPNGGR